MRRLDHIALVQTGKFDEVIDALFDYWVRPSRRDAAMRRVIRQMAHETGPDGFISQQTAIMIRLDSRQDLPAISCPTLVLVGAEDQSTTPEHAMEIAVGVPTSKLVVVPDCGHLSTLEQPKAVNAALIDWLEQGRQRRTRML